MRNTLPLQTVLVSCVLLSVSTGCDTSQLDDIVLFEPPVTTDGPLVAGVELADDLDQSQVRDGLFASRGPAEVESPDGTAETRAASIDVLVSVEGKAKLDDVDYLNPTRFAVARFAPVSLATIESNTVTFELPDELRTEDDGFRMLVWYDARRYFKPRRYFKRVCGRANGSFSFGEAYRM